MFRDVQECSMFLILSTARRANRYQESKGRYTRGSLLPKHAPGAKLPCLHQRFLAKKYVAQQNFCSRVLLPHIKLVWYEGASSRRKSVARFCFRSKLPRVHWNFLVVTRHVSSWPIKLAYFFHPQLIANPNRVVSSFSSLVVSFVCTAWGTERVSGASSLVCTGLNSCQGNKTYNFFCSSKHVFRV